MEFDAQSFKNLEESILEVRNAAKDLKLSNMEREMLTQASHIVWELFMVTKFPEQNEKLATGGIIDIPREDYGE